VLKCSKSRKKKRQKNAFSFFYAKRKTKNICRKKPVGGMLYNTKGKEKKEREWENGRNYKGKGKGKSYGKAGKN
jgi:hypothetical protein